MMSLRSDAASVSTPLALAKQHYNKALELEKQLRTLLQSKGPFDGNVRSLQISLREKYELVILEDHEISETQDVEQAIWRLHYKQIDEFRAKIKKINHVAAAAPKSGTQRDSVHKIVSSFKSFLAEVTGFYHNLILKLRAKNGLPQDYSSFESSGSAAMKADEIDQMSKVKRCQLSCHRCFIFLGDLARYKEVHANIQDTRSLDFSVAAGHYLQAASLWPASGNPHNQLAVLATYVSDELLAVYRYFRSLAVETPFLTARDNLILLFEKNRQQYSQLHVSKSVVHGGGPHPSSTGRGDRVLPLGVGTMKLAKKGVRAENADLASNSVKNMDLRSFRIRFVRMNGILFTRTSLETFSQVYVEVLSDLEKLLSGNDSNLEMVFGTDQQSRKSMGNAGPSFGLQIVSILIFTVHNINSSTDSANNPTYAEILQRPGLFQHALTAAFQCVGHLMRRCSRSKDPARSVLLPALLLFMEWLAGRPEMAIGSEVNTDQANARSSFWAECLILLNYLLKMFREESGPNNGLEGSGTTELFGGLVENERGVALWEDFELQGFTPLAPAQATLDYSRGSFRDGSGDKQFKVRIMRLLAAGKAVANALESTQRGICYDEELGKFISPGDARQEQKDEQLIDISIEYTVDSQEEKGNDSFVTSQSSSLASDNHLKTEDSVRTPAKVVSEEEDEEHIVFMPLTKDRPVASDTTEFSNSEVFPPPFKFSPLPTSEVSVQTSGKISWPSENLVDPQLRPIATKLQGPFHGQVQNYSGENSYPLDASKFTSSAKSGLVELATPSIFVAGSLPGSSPSIHDTTISFPTLGLSNLNSSGNETSATRALDILIMPSPLTSTANWLDQYTSSSTEPWLQGQKNVFTNFADKRMSASTASQAHSDSRSPWNSERESLDKYGVTDFVPSVPLNSRVSGDAVPNPSSLPILAISETSSGSESGKYIVPGNRDPITSTSSSWNTKEQSVYSRVSHPAMRPPPGFGPRPVKPVSKPISGISQGFLQPPSFFQSQKPNISEDNVDDYGWLDDFRTVKPVNSHLGYYSGERETQPGSSDRNLWHTNDVIAENVAFASGPYPFPGMGAHHHPWKFNSTVPPQFPSATQASYSESQKPVDETMAQVKIQTEMEPSRQQQLLYEQHQQATFYQRKQQQYQQQLPGQFHSRDPFVS